MSATAQRMYGLLSAGIAYHGAWRRAVERIASPYALM